jgi:hypothetical protein
MNNLKCITQTKAVKMDKIVSAQGNQVKDQNWFRKVYQKFLETFKTFLVLKNVIF